MCSKAGTLLLAIALGTMSGCQDSGDGETPSLRDGVYEIKGDCPGSEAAGGGLELRAADPAAAPLADYTLAGATAFGLAADGLAHRGPHKVVADDGAGRECAAYLFVKATSSALFVCKSQGEIICTVGITRTGDLKAPAGG